MHRFFELAAYVDKWLLNHRLLNQWTGGQFEDNGDGCIQEDRLATRISGERNCKGKSTANAEMQFGVEVRKEHLASTSIKILKVV
jgi:hypothetical protein